MNRPTQDDEQLAATIKRACEVGGLSLGKFENNSANVGRKPELVLAQLINKGGLVAPGGG